MYTEMTSAERLLFSSLSTYPVGAGCRTLVAGNRSGHIVLALHQQGADVTAHVFDTHHARAIRDRLTENGVVPTAIVQCSPQVLTGPYARAFFMTTPISMSAELVLDQLEDIRAQLAVGGVLTAAFEGEPQTALNTLKKVFAHVHVLPLPTGVDIGDVKKVRGVPQVAFFRVTKCEKDVAAARRTFTATWPASVPGGQTHEFISLPGCFCHRRADAGGLALAEVACARIREMPPATFPRLLDMGCGCGFVGLLVADFIRSQSLTPQEGNPTLLDSHTRALAAARLNAEHLNFPNARFVLSDVGLPTDDSCKYDIFLGNPPYFGDWQIAETFISTAFRALVPGGLCLTVAKSEAGLKALQERIFGKVAVSRRRGYFVFSSIRT